MTAAQEWSGPVDVTVDVRGARCPVPVITLARTVWGRPAGTVVALLADDPATDADIPAWCRMRRCELLARHPADDGRGTRYVVRGSGPRAGGDSSAAASSNR